MKFLSLFFVLSFFSSQSLSQTQIHLTDSITGAQSWEVEQHGVVLYMNQLLPDQIRAFYSSRGFTQDQISDYAKSCVFMTVLRNESAADVIHYKISDWRIEELASKRSVKTLNEWLQYNKNLGVSPSAMIAFQWAQFPEEQSYEPGGDWNQGMLSLGANKDSFDVIAHWTLQNKPFELKLKGVSCAL